jgi:uncharacterized membrane protein
MFIYIPKIIITIIAVTLCFFLALPSFDSQNKKAISQAIGFLILFIWLLFMFGVLHF